MTSTLLSEDISRASGELQKNRSEYSRGQYGEEKVKAEIIIPIIGSLDYLRPPGSYKAEYPLSNGSADYVLKIEEKPVLPIEVKALDKDVGPDSDCAKQLLDDLIELDLHFGVGTDGAVWFLYWRKGRSLFVKWRVDLLRDPPLFAAGKLQMISRNLIAHVERELQMAEAHEEALKKHWDATRNDRDSILELLANLVMKRAAQTSDSMSQWEIDSFLRMKYPESEPIIHDGRPVQDYPVTYDTGRPSRPIERAKQLDWGPQKKSARRRVLDTEEARHKAGFRAQEATFRLPILRALAELGGSGPAIQILELVYSAVRTSLTDADMEPVANGEPRWRNTARWCVKRMAGEGLMMQGPPRGSWTITKKGRGLVPD